jgi:hypothetical protein
MRLCLASLLFLVTTLNLQFGGGQSALEFAAFAGAITLAVTVVLDFLWLDPPRGRRQDRPPEVEPSDMRDSLFSDPGKTG